MPFDMDMGQIIIPLEQISNMPEESKLKVWTVFIHKIGNVEVEGTSDIDSAYINAMAKYNCKLDDILAVGPLDIE